ncbi:elongation of very long chain fatty acids protein 1 isoform X1 [Nasonia vitripennis]|uniref:Elongation of very long chain fatty acids protein n=3 Tax=Pteromalinae TaxID=272242 RepID=A0A7M7G8D4_NASVI|nr:elongation of very long chain fatty acids protein 1 isoform X1 [Nasonia vitripennis]OXU23578.1 hypothetical protein TSAR_009413 [Trichomalopsis sarcophagae]
MSLSELYRHYMVDRADPRTNSWFMVENPLYICSIVFGYAYFVLKCGPKFMEKREPYSLKNFIFYYNIFQIVSNSIIVYVMYTAGWTTEFTLGCEPLRTSTRPIDMRLLNVVHWTYMLKTIDLIETMVFVLRKKNNQISFLHVYHHISTVLVTYICTKYYPGGMLSMQMIINGSVHVIMYTYYLLASLGQSTQGFLNPIKPYITRIQIIQFLFLLWHQSQAFLPSCPIPKWIPFMVIGNLLLNLLLFLNFYKKSYSKRSKLK